MILIQQKSDTFYALTTDKNRLVEVGVNQCCASIYIRRNGMRGLSMGRHFWADSNEKALLKAIEAYKAGDIKAALRALLCELL